MDAVYLTNTSTHVADLVSENIPAELRRRRQWVVWKLEGREDDLTKVPYTPNTGRKAKSNDLMSWGTFEEAVEALHKGRYSGLGFVFCSGDPYTGIDLDNVRDLETGALERWAAEIVEAAAAYAEISPSGRGIHLIVRGRVPARKGKGLEIYSQDRFFTVTGRSL